MNGPSRLRELLREDRAVVAPGAFDCLSARLVEQAGFPCIHMTGAGAAASQIGAPDLGLMTLTEMVTHARHLVAAVNIPVLGDADTGYGHALNVIRTVREYETVGLAGCHIEDVRTAWPFKPATSNELATREEFAGKIRAAVASRRNPDFVIVGRTDSRKAVGLDEAIGRSQLALAAGADLIWIDGPESPEELAQIARRVPGPLAAVAAGLRGKTAGLRFRDFEAMGYRLLIVPVAAHQAAVAAIKFMLATLREAETLTPIADRLAPAQEVHNLLGLPAYEAAAREFMPISPEGGRG